MKNAGPPLSQGKEQVPHFYSGSVRHRDPAVDTVAQMGMGGQVLVQDLPAGGGDHPDPSVPLQLLRGDAQALFHVPHVVFRRRTV